MGDPTYPLFPIFSFAAFVLTLVPLHWHLEAWNAGTCLYIIWASLASLIQFVNSVVWRGNANVVSPVWCDISTKVIVGAGVGIPASALCISRCLYSIASIKTMPISRNDRRRIVYIDVAIAVGLPVLVMVFHYVVQGHRFDILGDIGCVPTTFNTIAAYPLVFMWPIVLGCVTFIYASLTLQVLWMRRPQSIELLCSNGSLTMSRYFRLMLLSCLVICCTLPLSIFSIYVHNEGINLVPWVSWEDAHSNFSFIQIIPAPVWKGSRSFEIFVEMSRWIFPVCGIMFFALFGFASEAQKNYCLASRSLLKALRLNRYTQRPLFVKDSDGYVSQKSRNRNDILPVYSPQPQLNTIASSGTSTLSGSDALFFKSPIFLSSSSVAQSVTLPTPPSPTYSEGETVYHEDINTRIIISDEFPASRPPSPPVPRSTQHPPTSLSFMAVDQPSCPPIMRKMTSLLSLKTTQEVESIMVSVHTESHTKYEV